MKAETEERQPRLTRMSSNQVDRLAAESAEQHEAKLQSHWERCEVQQSFPWTYCHPSSTNVYHLLQRFPSLYNEFSAYWMRALYMWQKYLQVVFIIE